MKNKIPIILLALLATAAIIFGYDQKRRYDTLRDINARLRNEVKEAINQSNAARLEASKLRYILQNEKKIAQAALDQANLKSQKKK